MTKQFFTFGILLFGTSMTFGQDLSPDQVPNDITNHFQQNFPDATKVEWEKEKNGYEVEFHLNPHLEHEINYDAQGNVLRHKEELPPASLPATIQDHLKANFSGYAIHEADKITEGKMVKYVIELKGASLPKLEVTMDAQGNILTQKED